MSDLDALLASLPIDSIAERLGEDPAAVKDAAAVALPALLGGLDANAQDDRGAASILEALTQHEDKQTDGVDLAEVDPADGEKIAAHIFGNQQDQVISQLGSTGASTGLVRKLIPILAPIVLAWLAKRMSSQGARPSEGADKGVLGTILEQVLQGAAQGSGGGSAPSVGSILGDVLSGLLGGGRR